MALERLQKIMAAAGVASRRKSEEMITAGRVSVNGQTVTELGAKADPATDHIKVDGKLLHGSERKVYLLLHKPKGYVSTVTDPQGRPTVMDLLRGVGERLYPVGRLDYMSEGLLLLTNDGELAARLTRAASHVPKTYLVKVSGKPSEDAIEKLRRGIVLPPENRYEQGKPERSVKTAPARITLTREAENPWYEVRLTEGRNRQIRRMFKQVGHDVEKIKRVRYGPLELDVEPGEYRRLEAQEIERLTRAPQRENRPPAREGRERVSRYLGKPRKPARDERREEGPQRPIFERRPPMGEKREFKRPKPPAFTADGREERPQEERRPRFGERRGEGKDRRPKFSPRGGDERRPKFGRTTRGEGKPFGRDDRARGPRSEGRSFGGERGPQRGPRSGEGQQRRGFSGRSEGGERRGFGGSPAGGERRGFGGRPEGGERRGFGKRPEGGERRGFGKRPEAGGGQRGFGKRPAPGGKSGGARGGPRRPRGGS